MSNPNQIGAYIPTTQVWDTTEVYQANIPDALKELLVRMYQNLNRMAINQNIKESGYYDTVGSFVDGNLWFPRPGLTSSTSGGSYPAFRQEERTVLNFGALGAGATSVNHNIAVTAATLFTRIFATASDTVGNNYYPIPWASAGGATNIEIKVNATQVTITNNSGINFTNCFVVLEYLQN